MKKIAITLGIVAVLAILVWASVATAAWQILGITQGGVGTSTTQVGGVWFSVATTDATRLSQDLDNLFWNDTTNELTVTNYTSTNGTTTNATSTNISVSGAVDFPSGSITKTNIGNSGTLSFDWADSEVADTLTIDSSSSIDKGALDNSGTLSFDWADSEVVDTLTIDSGTVVTAPSFAADTTATSTLINTWAENMQIGTLLELPFLTATSTATSTFTGGISASIFNGSSSSATSTFANGLDITGGCFSISGACVALTETNSLETTITAIADTEIFVGNGADSGTFVVISGDATLSNAGALTLDASNTSQTNLSALVETGALNAGSITSGFGGIDIGSSNFDADGTITSTGTIVFSGATSLAIPNNGTVNANGEITTDDTTGQFRYFAGSAQRVIAPSYPLRFTYASTTQGSGTTTAHIGVAPDEITVNTARCDFTNFMGVSLYDGTNRIDYFEASSTIGLITFATNNTFTDGEAMRIDIGTSTNINADVRGGCTFEYTYDAD